MNDHRATTAREEWKRLPLAWDSTRIARTPRTVARNWATMTETMRHYVRQYARQRGPVTLLDIGCGNGGFADGLEDVIERYIGVDPASEMLRLGRSRDGYAYVSGVGEAIPLSDGVADVVVLKTVLTHCYAPEAVLRETARASKPGSLIVISTANGRAWYHPLRLLRRRLARPGDAPDGYLYTFDATRLTQLVADAGLTPRVWRTLGYGVLPRVVDGRLSKRRVERFCNLADAIGGRFFPSRGGALILVAEKPK